MADTIGKTAETMIDRYGMRQVCMQTAADRLKDRMAVAVELQKKNLEGAKAWVLKGCTVIPVDMKIKHSALTWDNATNDPAKVKELFKRVNCAGIGVLTGKSSLICFDFDKKSRGLETLKSLVEKHPEIMETYREMTQSGGVHLIYKDMGLVVKSVNGKIEDCPGLDIKAKGAIVVVAPTEGADGKKYTATNDIMPADLPKCLQELLDKACLIEKPELYEEKPTPAINSSLRMDLLPPCMGELAETLLAGKGPREHGLEHLQRVALGSFLKDIHVPAHKIAEMFSAAPDFDLKMTLYQLGTLKLSRRRWPERTRTTRTWRSSTRG